MYAKKPEGFILRLLFSLTLLWMLAACGGEDESEAPPTEQSVPTETATTENTPTPIPTSTPTPEPTPTPTVTPTETAQAISDESSSTAGGASQLPNFPLPEDAQTVEYEATEITFSSPSDIETLVEFYRSALAADGWQEDIDFSQVDDTFAFVEFDRSDESIYLTLISFDSLSEATIDLSEALSWVGDVGSSTDETGAAGPAYTINDWPAPPEAVEVNLSGEELSYKVAWSLAEVAEFYRPTFELMGLDTGCLDTAITEGYTSMSCSISTGDFSLNFFAFEGLDNQSEVEISFTNYALSPTDESSSGGDSEELTAVDQNGLPVPSDYTGVSSEDSPFRQNVMFTSPSDIQTLLEFYQTELAARDWQLENTDEAAEMTAQTYSGPDGSLTLTLKSTASETEGNLIVKNSKAAGEAGILPPAGQARVYLINFSDQEITVVLNDQTLKIPAGAGMDSPDDAPKLDLPPNTYAVTTQAGSNSVTDEISVGADEVWSLLLDVQGALPLQMY